MRRHAGIGFLLTVLALGLGASLAVAASSSRAASPTTLPNFGNPNGHFPVPPGGNAVSIRHPDHVIGNGTPTRCTSAAVVRAVAAGGVITFNCGPKPLTIVLASAASVPKTRQLVVIDGGGLITLSGGGKHRILYSNTCDGTWSTSNCTDQPYPQIVVQNITFRDGFDDTPQATCTDNAPPCWFGGVNGGGAIFAEGGQFKAVNSLFIDNGCHADGPDLGGGAIRALVQYQNRPVFITNDTFRGGYCSNGGALSSIQVKWTIVNSVFTGNRAIGFGANPADSGTAGGGSGGALYFDGKDDDVLIAGSVITGNSAKEGGGAVFDVVDIGSSALTFNQSQLSNNTSGQFQNFPGVYYYVLDKDTDPTMIGSTAS